MNAGFNEEETTMFRNISNERSNFGITPNLFNDQTQGQREPISGVDQSQQTGIEEIEKQIQSLETQLDSDSKEKGAPGEGGAGGGIEQMLAEVIEALKKIVSKLKGGAEDEGEEKDGCEGGCGQAPQAQLPV